MYSKGTTSDRYDVRYTTCSHVLQVVALRMRPRRMLQRVVKLPTASKVYLMRQYTHVLQIPPIDVLPGLTAASKASEGEIASYRKLLI